MRSRRWKAGALTAALGLLLALGASAASDSYWYNRGGTAVEIPDAYTLARTVPLDGMAEGGLSGITDAFVAADGRIYILDRSGVILILDDAFGQIGCIDYFYSDEAEETLSEPEGLFVDNQGVIYVADTGNFRIVKLTQEGEVLGAYYRPDNLTGADEQLDYLPSKLAVDSAGRMFVVVRNINMGVVVLDREGRFIAYRGAPSVKLSLYDMFWRRFSTQEQLDRMTTYVPIEYNNLTIDADNFLYGTISSITDEDLTETIRANDLSGTAAPIKKLNLAGEDILRRKGLYPPVGDLTVKSLSTFCDVALADCGIYTVLDSAKGRLFTYNDDGELLFAFGGIGDRHDSFRKPVAVSYAGERLLVFDEELRSVFCFEETAYGGHILGAVRRYYNGDYDAAYAEWRAVQDYNANLTLAYVGIGKAYYQDGEYGRAMECFRIAGDRANYSMVYRKMRDNFVRRYFRYFAAGILVIAAAGVTIGSAKRFRRYIKKG